MVRSTVTESELLRAKGTIRVWLNGKCARRRLFYGLRGLVHRDGLGVYDASVVNAERALKERYLLVQKGGRFLPPIRPMDGFYTQECFSNFRENFSVIRPRVYSRLETACLYSGAKRKVYLQAYESLMREDLTPRDATLKMFVKFEKQDLKKAPRCINPRGPRYTLELARYLKKLEKPCYEAINRMFHSRTVVKGMNCRDTASVIRRKWDSFDDPVAIGLDAVKFDMHVSVDALRFEHSVYNSIFGSNRLKRLLTWQIQNKGRAYFPDGKLEFSIQGTRSSGDINTSLGNVIIMCSILWTFKVLMPYRVEFINNGDDSVCFVERANLDDVLADLVWWCAQAGFDITTEEPVDEFEEIEFCQTHPVFAQDGWRMVRNLDAVLRKDGLCLHPIANELSMRKWMYAVGDCNDKLHHGIPVLHAMAKAFKRNGVRCNERFLSYVHKNTSMEARLRGFHSKADITPESRSSFYIAFGVKPDEQVLMEKWFDSYNFNYSVDSRLQEEMVLDFEPINHLFTSVIEA